MTLVPVDPTSEIAVTDYLTKARDWLATAVETSTPHGIAGARAELRVAEEATKQLQLSEDIQEDAKEMVRRAEYALGRALHKGRAEGTVSSRSGGHPYWGNQHGAPADAPQGKTTSVGEFFSGGKDEHETMAIGAVEPAAFEAALKDAQREGNPSRANIARKVKGETNAAPLTRDQRADLIADLAEQGYTSHQMADRVGVLAGRVREIARAFKIDIPADRVVGRGSQRIDHTAAVESAVTRLEHLTDSLKFIDFTEVDGSQTDEWTVSLTNSIRALNRFKKQIEETIHVH